MRFLLPLLATAAIAFAPRPAEACSAPVPMAKLAPANGATIPANAPALVLMRVADPTGKVTLETLAGGAIELTLEAEKGDWLQRPKTALVAGTQYRATFPKGPFSAGETTTQTFTAAPDAPLPTSFGSIAAGPSTRRRLIVGTSSGSCTSEIDAAVVDVTIALAKDFDQWMPLTAFEAKIDGEVWGAPGYGAGATLPPPAPSAPYHARAPNLVFAKCAGDDSGADPGVAPGKHTLDIRAHVAGAASDPPKVSIDIELACDGVTPDGGAPDAGAPAASSEDAGGCACTLAKQQLATHAPLGIAFAFVTVGALRRRRK